MRDIKMIGNKDEFGIITSQIRKKIFISKNESIIRYGYDKKSVYVRGAIYDVRKYEVIHPRRKYKRLIEQVEKENGINNQVFDYGCQKIIEEIDDLLNSSLPVDSFLMKKVTCLSCLADELKEREWKDFEISIREFSLRLPEKLQSVFELVLVDIQRLFPERQDIVHKNIMDIDMSTIKNLKYYYEKSISEEIEFNYQGVSL